MVPVINTSSGLIASIVKKMPKTQGGMCLGASVWETSIRGASGIGGKCPGGESRGEVSDYPIYAC